MLRSGERDAENLREMDHDLALRAANISSCLEDSSKSNSGRTTIYQGGATGLKR